MKTKLRILFGMVPLLYLVTDLSAQPPEDEIIHDKVESTPHVTFVFDYQTKQWACSNGESKHNRGKYYFLVPYKSQPIIRVNNVPSKSTVSIESNLIDVSQQAENPEKKDASDKLKNESIKVNEMIDSLKSLPELFYMNENTVTEQGRKALIEKMNENTVAIRTLKDRAASLEKKLEESTKDVVQTTKMIDSDEVEFTVTITDDNGKRDHTTTAYAKVYGGLMIDLSSGVIFHNLSNHSYSYNDTGNGKSSLTRDKTREVWRPLFPVILTSVYWRSKGFTSVGFSFGLGVDDMGKAGYYLGTSILMGDRQRAVISSGFALRPVNRLKGKYESYTDGSSLFDNTSKPATDDLVEAVYQPGIFLSLTYNLTSPKIEKRK